MSIPDAVNLVIKAGEQGKDGEVWIMDMGVPRSIMELQEEYFPDANLMFIGARPGEALSEQLMTKEEKERAIKKDNFYILCK